MLRSMEERDSGSACVEIPPLRICSGEVSAECPQRARRGVVKQRHLAALDPIRARSHQRGERMVRDHFTQHIDALLAE